MALIDAQDIRAAAFREAREQGPTALGELVQLECRYQIAAALTRARHRRRLTQQRLAEAANVPRDTISHLEAAQANPTMATLTALAQRLGAELTIELTRAAAR